MQKFFIRGILHAVILFSLVACGKKDSASTGGDAKKRTGTFTVGEKTVTGKMSIQHFETTGEFSIVCQNDDAGLVQLTFKTEADARTPQSMKVVSRSAIEGIADKGMVDISFRPFTSNEGLSSKEGAAGSVKVSKSADGNEVVLENVQLSSIDGKAKSPVSAKMSY